MAHSGTTGQASAVRELVKSFLSFDAAGTDLAGCGRGTVAGAPSHAAAAATWRDEERLRAAGRRKLAEFMRRKRQLKLNLLPGVPGSGEPASSIDAGQTHMCTCCARCAALRLQQHLPQLPVALSGSSPTHGAQHDSLPAASHGSVHAGCSPRHHPADSPREPHNWHQAALHCLAREGTGGTSHGGMRAASGPLPSCLSLSPLACQHELLRRLIPTASLSRADAQQLGPCMSEVLQRTRSNGASEACSDRQEGAAAVSRQLDDLEAERSPVAAAAVPAPACRLAGTSFDVQPAAGTQPQPATVATGAAPATGTPAKSVPSCDPLVDLLLAQVKELMKEKSDLQGQVAWLLAENSAMQELIGYLAEHQCEHEEEGDGEQDGLLPEDELLLWFQHQHQAEVQLQQQQRLSMELTPPHHPSATLMVHT